MGLPRDDKTLFASNNSSHLEFSHTLSTHSVSNAEQGLKEMVRNEAGVERWTRLFPTQVSVAHTFKVISCSQTQL